MFWQAVLHLLDAIRGQRGTAHIDTLSLKGISSNLLPVPPDCRNALQTVLDNVRDLRVFGSNDRFEISDRQDPQFQRAMLAYAQNWASLFTAARNTATLTLGVVNEDFGDHVVTEKNRQYVQSDVLHALLRSVQFPCLKSIQLHWMRVFPDDYRNFLQRHRSTLERAVLHIVKLTVPEFLQEDDAWEYVFEAIQSIRGIKQCMGIMLLYEDRELADEIQRAVVAAPVCPRYVSNVLDYGRF